MDLLPAERQRQILSSLAESGAVRISDLSRTFDVSEMTIHRDLNALAGRGRLTKVRGGAVLSRASETERACTICRREHQGRMQMVLNMKDEGQWITCCPHCGLMALLDVHGQVRSALVTDFLYGRMVNCRAATYVIEPQISVCCSPTVLAFEKPEDALRFQRGFSGRVAQFEEALAMIESEMALNKG